MAIFLVIRSFKVVETLEDRSYAKITATSTEITLWVVVSLVLALEVDRVLVLVKGWADRREQ